MKKCPKCGQTYDDSWKVCLRCDVALSDDPSIRETNPEIIEKQEAKPPSKYVKLSLLLLFAVLGFIAIGASAEFIGEFIFSEDYYRRQGLEEGFLKNIDQYSKADILQLIRNGEQYSLSYPQDEEFRKAYELFKEKSKQRLLRKP